MAFKDDYIPEGLLVAGSNRVPEYAKPGYDPTTAEAAKRYLGERIAAPSASPAGRWWQRHGIMPEVLTGDAPRTMSEEEQAFRNRVLADALAVAEQRKKTEADYGKLAETASALREMPRVTGSTYFEPISDEELARREQEEAARAQAIINRQYPNPAAEPGGATPITDTARSVLRQRLNLPVQGSVAAAPAITPPASVEGEPGYTTPGAAAQWAYGDINAKPLGAPPASAGAGRGAAPAMLGSQLAEDMARAQTENAALDRKQVSSPTPRPAPLPPKRPVEFAPATEQGNQSLFSSILERLKPQDPYAGMSRQQMAQRAQEMQRSGDEAGANILTQRLDRGITSPDQQSSDGMKRGGTAKTAGPHKDAALHKALDIIHTMLQRGR